MPYYASLHEQQNHPRLGISNPKGQTRDAGRLEYFGWHGPGIGDEDKEGNGLLQGSIAEGLVVSRTLPARRLGGKSGGNVRPKSVEGRPCSRGLDASRHKSAGDPGSSFRTGIARRRTGAIACVLAHALNSGGMRIKRGSRGRRNGHAGETERVMLPARVSLIVGKRRRFTWSCSRHLAELTALLPMCPGRDPFCRERFVTTHKARRAPSQPSHAGPRGRICGPGGHAGIHALALWLPCGAHECWS